MSTSWLQVKHPLTKERLEDVADLQAIHGNPVFIRMTSKPGALHEGQTELIFCTSL